MKNIIFLMFIAFIVIGCAKKEIVYVDRFTEVKVPVKCVVPEVQCKISEDITGVEVIKELLHCIQDLRTSIEVCQ